MLSIDFLANTSKEKFSNRLPRSFKDINTQKDVTVELRSGKKTYGVAGDWTPDFSHAKRTLYHWVTTPRREPYKWNNSSWCTISGPDCSFFVLMFRLFHFTVPNTNQAKLFNWLIDSFFFSINGFYGWNGFVFNQFLIILCRLLQSTL